MIPISETAIFFISIPMYWEVWTLPDGENYGEFHFPERKS